MNIVPNDNIDINIFSLPLTFHIVPQSKLTELTRAQRGILTHSTQALTHTSIWINRNLKSSFAINLFYCFFFGCSFLICVRFYYVTLVFIEFNFGKWEKININFIHREFHEQKLWAKFDFSVTVMPGKKSTNVELCCYEKCSP